MAAYEIVSTALSSENETLPAVFQVGGDAIVPRTPTISVAMAGVPHGYPTWYVPDQTGRCHYFVDGSGNIQKLDLQNTGAGLVEIATASAIGATIKTMDISLDSTTLYATTSANKVISILTSAPYTVTTLAGSGTAATTDGTGAAAAFDVPSAIMVEPVNGLLLYVYDSSSGDVRQITIATGVVVTTGNIGGFYAVMQMGASGKLYCTTANEITAVYAASCQGEGTVITESSYLAGFCLDQDHPTESNLYLVENSSNSLVRWNAPTGGSPVRAVVATLPNAVPNAIGGMPMYYRPLGVLWLVDSSGNLIKVQA